MRFFRAFCVTPRHQAKPASVDPIRTAHLAVPNPPPTRSPSNPSSLLIKRLVALPKTLVRTLPPYSESTVRVPPGHCWIEGDERFHTRDSNTFGPVPLGLIESKVEYIVWPPR